jgi:hypothetical protein
MDKLIECSRCGGNACYEQQLNEEVTTWMCLGCGFTSSTVLLEDSKLYHDLIETSPSLYVDLLTKDDSGKIWAPSTITIPKKGMVFADGTAVDNWSWTAVKAIKLTAEEIESGKYPEGNEWRMDMQNKKVFNRSDFMDAMEYIGFFQVEI